jgi:hypothetical protein
MTSTRDLELSQQQLNGGISNEHPYIYQIRDAHELDLMKKEIQRKKVFGLWKVQVTR